METGDVHVRVRSKGGGRCGQIENQCWSLSEYSVCAYIIYFYITFFLILKSFRFGPEIAYVASCVLDVLKGIRNKTLVGGSKKGEYICTGFTFISFDVSKSRPVGCLHTCVGPTNLHC